MLTLTEKGLALQSEIPPKPALSEGCSESIAVLKTHCTCESLRFGYILFSLYSRETLPVALSNPTSDTLKAPVV